MASTHDMMFRYVVRFQQDIVDGFLDADTVASHLSMTREAAARALHCFSRKARDAAVHVIDQSESLRVFQEISCHRGELRWLFGGGFLDQLSEVNLSVRSHSSS